MHVWTELRGQPQLTLASGNHPEQDPCSHHFLCLSYHISVCQALLLTPFPSKGLVQMPTSFYLDQEEVPMPSTETVYNSASILVPIAINQTALNLGVREAILLITDFVGQDLSSTELESLSSTM